MGNAVATLSLSIALEEFSYLEEKHDKYRLRKLCLCPWQKTDAESSDSGYRHEEVLIEDIPVHQSFQSLFQGVVANEQIGHEVNQEQLPQRQTQVLLDEDGDDEQDGCDDNQGELFLQAVLVVMMLMFMLMMMFKMVFMFVLAALVMMMLV